MSNGTQTSHDEPIVVDNGPIELDFGPVLHAADEVQQTSSGLWERKNARFEHLLVLQTKANGDIELFEDKDLDPAQPLTFHLGTNADPNLQSIVFDLSAADKDRTVKLNPGGIVFNKTSQPKVEAFGRTAAQNLEDPERH